MFKTISSMLSLSLMIDPVFLIFAVSNLLTSVGFNSPLYFLPMHATRGLSLDSASSSKVISVYGTVFSGLQPIECDLKNAYMNDRIPLLITGVCNTLGRVVFGVIADHQLPLPYGLGRDTARNRLWMYNITLSLCGLFTTFCFLCAGFVSLAIYAGLFGFSIACYICLTSVILVDLLGLDKLTSAFGLLLLWQGAGTVFGPPIAGYLADITYAYTWSFIFCGVNLLVRT
ncbi:unnamed protein product [Strongylus vulgaris]|uniref:Major facilitator superfamily (MFS) profile domain-containing protein n=1 Tax=Strongylus vulgaris TaxID=40348 RepID=A0A3P7JKD6_STRVU|nr:unnamed protein product [Strongylus vulgaris]